MAGVGVGCMLWSEARKRRSLHNARTNDGEYVMYCAVKSTITRRRRVCFDRPKDTRQLELYGNGMNLA
jgi:hypothetical protein